MTDVGRNNEFPEFVPLNVHADLGADNIPVVLLAGFSEADVSRLADVIRQTASQPPAIAMIPDGVTNWTVGEYLDVLRNEHKMFTSSAGDPEGK